MTIVDTIFHIPSMTHVLATLQKVIRMGILSVRFRFAPATASLDTLALSQDESRVVRRARYEEHF